MTNDPNYRLGLKGFRGFRGLGFQGFRGAVLLIFRSCRGPLAVSVVVAALAAL